MAEHTQIRLRALALFAAPLLMLASMIYHPYLTDEFDISAVAEEVLADPDRWVAVHIMLMVTFALIMIAAVVIRGMLRTAGEERWSFIAVPLLIGGSTVFAGVWGFEITVAGVANVGGDVEAVFDETDRWLGPVGIAGYVMFILGWGSMAFAVRRSQLLGRRQTWLVLGATVVMIAGLSYPATGGGYLFSIGMMGFTWTLGYHALSGVRAASSQAAVAGAD